MAWKFRYSLDRRVIDRLLKWLIRINLAPKSYYTLTVLGRKSGKPRSTPVALVEDGDNRWLVAPYGEVEWVKNARAAGCVSLSRGKISEVLSIAELPPEKSTPILKEYVTRYPIARPYFDVKTGSSLNEFMKEASLHPVFELHEVEIPSN